MSNSDCNNIMKPVDCWGRAKEVLQVYRRRFRELEAEHRAKPDMIACKELKGEWMPERRHGELAGVPIGLMLNGRGEAAILGIHRKILSGIDAVQGRPCYAVCVSGGYADDDDQGPNGTIIYTGEGGQDKRRVQVADQSYQSVGNAALLLSIQTSDTIRVIRGPPPTYFYLGLYRCTDYTYQEGIHGKKVFRFKLVPLLENQSPVARAIPLRFKFHPRPSQTQNLAHATVAASLPVKSELHPRPLLTTSAGPEEYRIPKRCRAASPPGGAEWIPMPPPTLSTDIGMPLASDTSLDTANSTRHKRSSKSIRTPTHSNQVAIKEET